MNLLRTRNQSSAGFYQSGFIELLLLAYIIAAVLNLVIGNWLVATVMLVPVAALFIWVQYIDRRGRCQTGDHVQVMLGPHTGKTGAVIAQNEARTRFTVQFLAGDDSAPVEFADFQLAKLSPKASHENAA